MTYCSYPTSLARFTIKVIGLLTSCFTNQCEVNWVIICNHEHSFCCTEATGLLTYFESQVDNAPLNQTECIFSHTDLRTSPLPPPSPPPPPPWQVTDNSRPSSRETSGWSQTASQALAPLQRAISGSSTARQPPGTGAGQKVRA